MKICFFVLVLISSVFSFGSELDSLSSEGKKLVQSSNLFPPPSSEENRSDAGGASSSSEEKVRRTSALPESLEDEDINLPPLEEEELPHGATSRMDMESSVLFSEKKVERVKGHTSALPESLEDSSFLTSYDQPVQPRGRVSVYQHTVKEISSFLSRNRRDKYVLDHFPQQYHYYSVKFSSKSREMSVILLPGVEATFFQAPYMFNATVYASIFDTAPYQEDDRNLIKPWSIPEKDVTDAIRRTEVDIRLLNQQKITIQYDAKKTVHFGKSLSYSNTSYVKYVLSFSKIIKRSDSEQNRFKNFSQEISQYTFDPEFDYMHNTAPTQINTLVDSCLGLTR